MSKQIKMVKEDVHMAEVDLPACDGPSELCTYNRTHTVWIDIRASGGAHDLGDYCETCAREIVARIQASLPSDDSPEQDGTTEQDRSESFTHPKDCICHHCL